MYEHVKPNTKLVRAYETYNKTFEIERLNFFILRRKLWSIKLWNPVKRRMCCKLRQLFVSKHLKVIILIKRGKTEEHSTTINLFCGGTVQPKGVFSLVISKEFAKYISCSTNFTCQVIEFPPFQFQKCKTTAWNWKI